MRGGALLTRWGLTDCSLWVACGTVALQHGARLSCGRSGLPAATAFKQQACTDGALQQASTKGTKPCALRTNEATVASTRTIGGHSVSRRDATQPCQYAETEGQTSSTVWRRDATRLDGNM